MLVLGMNLTLIESANTLICAWDVTLSSLLRDINYSFLTEIIYEFLDS